MKGILKLYSQYGDKIIIIPVLCIILCMVTYFIHIITKKSKFPKYLPGLAFIIFGIFKFKSGWKNLVYSSGLQDLWIFTLVFTSGFVAICFALILGTLSKKKKTKKIIKNKRKRTSSLNVSVHFKAWGICLLARSILVYDGPVYMRFGRAPVPVF